MAVIDPEHLLHLQSLATKIGRRLEPLTRRPNVRATADIPALMDEMIPDIQAMLIAAIRAKGAVGALVAYVGITVGEFANAERHLTLCAVHFKQADTLEHFTTLSLDATPPAEMCAYCLKAALADLVAWNR